MLGHFVGRGETEQQKKGKGYRTSLLESIETDGQQKKEPWLRLTKGNHADFFRILVTRAEETILTFLTHPGNQELLLGKLAVKPFDFTAAGHAHARLHLRDPVREQYVCWSFLDV
jgi:hypothetical protein